MPDADAVAGLDHSEMLLRCLSRGDECPNRSDTPILDGQELLIRVNKR